MIKLRTFDVFDGARPGLTSLQQQASVSPDGRLWFANGVVLQTIEPSRLTANRLPPPVHVERIIADRKDYSPRENLRLSALKRDLEIQFTADSFVSARESEGDVPHGARGNLANWI